MRPKRILVACQLGNEGFILPNLGLARALVEDGQEVYFHAPPWAREKARAAGCTPLDAPVGDALDILLGRKAGKLARSLEAVEEAAGLEVAGYVDRLGLDGLIVHGFAHFGPALAAEKLGIPWLTFADEPWILAPAAQRSSLAKMNSGPLRHKLGLPRSRLNAMQQCLSERLVLLNWTPAFDAAAPPPQALHLGPLNHDLPGAPPQWLAQLEPPVVLASVSTYPHASFAALEERLVASVTAAAEALGVRCVVTLSGTLDTLPVDTRTTRFVRFLPHHLVLPYASALVGHGGWGQIGRALSHGVPLLLSPFAWDQFLNGKLAKRNGVAAVVDVAKLDAKLVTRQLELLLAPESSFRRQARKVARVIRGLAPATAAARAVRQALS